MLSPPPALRNVNPQWAYLAVGVLFGTSLKQTRSPGTTGAVLTKSLLDVAPLAIAQEIADGLPFTITANV
jgi:hypothetical protein